MTSAFLLVAGVVVLAFALRSFANPVMFRIGSLGFVAASFLAGWLLGGSLVLGVFLGASWLMLPWIEILTRLRKLRIPSERQLALQRPPNRTAFPALEDLTGEIEEAGFEHSEDVGWEDDTSRQFFRLFSDPQSTSHASICLAEQGEFSFYYLSITSRDRSGRVFMTWNYPFPYGLKFCPALEVHRVSGTRPFPELLAAHHRFLRSHGIADGRLVSLDAAALIEAMQKDLRTQIRHNLDAGILRKDGESHIRYTPRGLVFLWCQFLRDLLNFS